MTASHELDPAPLILGDKELASLSSEALNCLLSAQSDLQSVNRWARAGALAQAVRDGYGAGNTKLRNIRLEEALYRKTIARVAPEATPAERYELLLAAAEGVVKLRSLHQQPLGEASQIVADYFQSLCAVVSQRRYGPDPHPQGALETSFLDPRFSIKALAPQFFHFAIHSGNMALWAQMELKEGFKEALASAFMNHPPLRETIIARGLDPYNHEKSPATRTLAILWELQALPPETALSLAYHHAHGRVNQRVALDWAGVPWPKAGENPSDPVAPLLAAVSHKAPAAEIERFFERADLDGWALSSAQLARPGQPTQRLLWRAAITLPPELFERMLDRLDQAGPSAWAQWMAGDPIVVELDSRSAKPVDWITALCHAGQSIESVERVIARVESFSFSETKASLRWLRERSVGAKSAEGLSRAKSLLTRTLTAQEALELRSHSLRASAKAAVSAPSPDPTPARRRSL